MAKRILTVKSDTGNVNVKQSQASKSKKHSKRISDSSTAVPFNTSTFTSLVQVLEQKHNTEVLAGKKPDFFYKVCVYIFIYIHDFFFFFLMIA